MPLDNLFAEGQADAGAGILFSGVETLKENKDAVEIFRRDPNSIIGNGEPPVIVLRAIGPTLSSFGITQPLQDPTLELRDANGALIAFNDDWNDNTPTAIKATLLQPTDSRESAIVASLAAGNYTAVVRGKNGTTGVALVEAYRLHSP